MPHSGFSVDANVYLPPGDVSGLERLARYIVHFPFSLARIIRVMEKGSVVYRSEKTDCHPFPESASNDLRGGPRHNFQVFDPLHFLAELTQHIPDKGEHDRRIRARTHIRSRIVYMPIAARDTLMSNQPQTVLFIADWRSRIAVCPW